MKLLKSLIVAFAALVLAGCSSYQGGTGNHYESTTGGAASGPTVDATNGTPAIPPLVPP